MKPMNRIPDIMTTAVAGRNWAAKDLRGKRRPYKRYAVTEK
jgi:hypothetical protein